MSSLLRRSGLLLAFALAALPGLAAPQIKWAIIDFPPTYIVAQSRLHTDTPGQGIGDRLLALLTRQLPQYEHQLELSNLPRILQAMRAGQPLCFLNGTLSHEREALAYASPLTLTPSLQVVFRQPVLDQHPEWRDGVSLRELVQRPELRGQYLQGRAFGPPIDAIVQADSNRGLLANGGATPVNQLRMLALGRVDYMLEHPQMLTYLRRQGLVTAELVSVPIREAPPLMVGYTLCTRSAWGKSVMADIQPAIGRLLASKAYRQLMTEWLPEADQRRYARDFEQFYRRPAMVNRRGPPSAE